jgi:hypothetical protein
MRPLVSVLAGSVGLMGCAPPDPCGDGAPTVALTRADDPHALLAHHERLEVVHGPQGGWHLQVGVRVHDPNPEVGLVLQVEALGARLLDQRYDLRVRDHDGCVGWRGGLLAILDLSAVEPGDGTPADRLAGQVMVVIAGVTASTGEAEARVEAIGGGG